MELKKFLTKQLRELASKIDRNEVECNKEESMRILSLIAHEPMSKEAACFELNISRSTFDRLVRDGKLPTGLHRMGFKELVWYKDELYMYIEDNDNGIHKS